MFTEQIIEVLRSRRQSRRLTGGPAFVKGGQSFKLSTKAADFKIVSLLIGGTEHVDWGGWLLFSAGPEVLHAAI